jgi:hypothetical protein
MLKIYAYKLHKIDRITHIECFDRGVEKIYRIDFRERKTVAEDISANVANFFIFND